MMGKYSTCQQTICFACPPPNTPTDDPEDEPMQIHKTCLTSEELWTETVSIVVSLDMYYFLPCSFKRNNPPVTRGILVTQSVHLHT